MFYLDRNTKKKIEKFIPFVAFQSKIESKLEKKTKKNQIMFTHNTKVENEMKFM